MKFVLIISGIWNLLFAFSKWSAEAQSRLLKALCIVNGCILTALGIWSAFREVNAQQVFVPFSLSLLLIGALINHDSNHEQNTISKLAIVSAFVLVALSIALVLLASDVSDYISACVTLTCCIMILSAPFSVLDEKMRKSSIVGEGDKES